MRIDSLHDALKYYPDIDGFWEPGNLPATEARILAQLPQQWATDWSSKSVEMLSQLARVQALLGKFPDARATLDQASQMIAEAKSKLDVRSEIRWNLEQGRVFCLSMNPAKAHAQFARAWEMANDARLPFFAIDAALMLSSLRPQRQQNDWLKKALSLAQEGPRESAGLWLAHLHFLNGWHAFDFRRFVEALDNFDLALTDKSATGAEIRVPAVMWSKARTLRALDRTAEALEIQESLLAQMTETGKVNGHVYLEIAECKQLLNRTEEAKGFFEMAYNTLLADPWFADNRADELERMKYLYKKR